MVAETHSDGKTLSPKARALLFVAVALGVALVGTFWAAVPAAESPWVVLAVAYGLLWGSLSGAVGASVTLLILLAVKWRGSTGFLVAASLTGSLVGNLIAIFVFDDWDPSAGSIVSFAGCSIAVSALAIAVTRLWSQPRAN